MKQKKHNSSLADTNTTIYETHQSINYAPLAIVIIVGAIILIIFGWNIGIFLFEKAGYYNPENTLASVIIYGLCGIVLFLIMGYLGWAISANFLDKVIKYKLLKKDKELELAQIKYRQKEAGHIDKGAITEEDKRFNDTCEYIFDLVLSNGSDHDYSIGCPWAINSLSSVMLSDGEVGYKTASSVNKWLKQKGMVLGTRNNQKWNWNKWDHLAKLQREIYLPKLNR